MKCFRNVLVLSLCVATPVLSGCAASGQKSGANAHPLLGAWDMKTTLGGQVYDAVMTISRENGKFVGMWESMGREMEMFDLKVSGTTLTFSRSAGRGVEMHFTGTFKDDAVTGSYTSPMGELECSGTRQKEG